MSNNLEGTQSILIATLGTEPQVVTVTLDLLNKQGFKIKRVEILHTTQPHDSPISQSVATLNQEFSTYAGYKNIPLTLVPIKDQEGNSIQDIQTPKSSEAAFRLLYQRLHAAKKRGEQVHLSIAGGRKNLSIFGMVAAQLLFDENDKLWHLYSGGDFLVSKRLHPKTGDEVHLINIPVVLWSHTAPAFLDLSTIKDPFKALEKQQELRLNEIVTAQRHFVDQILTEAEERVVLLLVQHGYTDQKIALTLHISPRTVGDHLQSAYQKAAEHWKIPSVKRGQLISLLNLYYKTKIP